MGSRLDYAPDRLLVKFRASAQPERQTDGAWRTGEPCLDRLLAEQHVLATERLFLAQQFEGDTDPIGLGCIYVVRLEPDHDLLQAVEAFSADPNVEWAEPDYLADQVYTIPDDPLFAGQWGLVQIEAPAAWDVVIGNPAVAIAIVDSGLDLTHPDLQSQLWVNPGEIPGDGLDNDNNGYVDDVKGWDFVNDDNNPADDYGHGTQVAGVAAAATDNGLGMAGVCWGCRLMPVKVMQASGVANYSDIAQGVLYSAQKGAKVINLSLGGRSYSSALHTAIQAATGTYGAVVIGGAGNDNTSAPFYPAAYPEVLAVVGTTQVDTKAPFSDYGTWVDVSAPAVAITTTFMGGDWGPADGTSFATAFVSGLAGLIHSQQPSWSEALVRAQIVHTADPIDVLNPDHEGLLGSGRINAAAAATVDPHPILAVDSTAVNGDPLGRPVPGQSATLQVTMGNDWLDATGVTGTLTTDDPYVTISDGLASFGDITPGETGTGSPVYTFTVATGAGYNHPIPFGLEVTADGGAYTTSLPVTITTRSADEPVGGTITIDTTWTNDKRYIVNSNLGVAPGVTLTIEAGTEVRFNGSYSLNVGGTLIADGTEAQPIRFVHHTGGTWGRIYFDDPSANATATPDGVYLSGNLLRWVQMDGAAQGIACNNATPYLAYVTTTGGGLNCTTGTTLWLTASELTGEVTIQAGDEGSPVLGTWSPRTAMPTARYGLGVAAAGSGKIYAIGGGDANGPFATVEEYDPATDSWTARASMPTAQLELGVVAADNGKIYVIGGASGNLAAVLEYDMATDSWTTRASMPTARYDLGVAAASNGKIYAIGGHFGTSALATVEEYDPTTDSWTIRTSMPTARYGLGVAAASNGKIYAIGGGDAGPLATVEEYDPATDSWTARASMPTARLELGVTAASNGKIYAIGGDHGENIVEEYDPTTDSWTARGSMPTARYYLGVTAASNGKIYAIGGGDAYDPLAVVEEYTLPSEVYGYHVRETDVLNGGLGLPDYSEVLTSTINGNVTAGSYSRIHESSIGATISLGESGSITENTALGMINLGSGTVSQNSVSNGDISLGHGSVLSNTISGGGIVAGDGSIILGNSIEHAPSWGIQTGSNATVTRNRVMGDSNGIQISGGMAQGNLVANSTGTGLEINGNTTVISNTFTGNTGSAIKIVSATSLQITNNNLEFNTGQYDIENLVPSTNMATISAQGNWWGTTNPTIIDQRIYDFIDDYYLGQVLYSPVATGPVQIAPAYVRSAIVTPDPVGIETATFDVEFSRPMDQASQPELSFQLAKHGTWTVHNTTNSVLPDDYVSAIATDPDGSLWFGTFGGGVAHLDDVNWTVYNTGNSGLPDNDVLAITTEPDGTHWFGTFGGGVAYFDGIDWIVYNTSNSGLPSNEVYTIATDPDGTHWFGTQAGGAARFDGTNWTVYNTGNSGLPYNIVYAIVTALDGSHWFGTWEGVAQLDGAGWTVYNPDNSPLPDHMVNVIAADPDGSYWFGTGNGGVAHFDGVDWTVYDTGNSGLPGMDLRAIITDPDGSHWFGTYGGGAAHFDGTDWIVYDTSNSGLPGNHVYALAIDPDGSHWFGTMDGVAVLWNKPVYRIENNVQWLDDRTFYATYDVTSLIPRADYPIRVAGAIGTNGIEIAPTVGFTFTVDYAGAVGDTSPPPSPAILACGAASPDTLSAHWYAYDPDSAITLYQYAIGSTPGSIDVINWTPTIETDLMRTGLSLTAGQTYYVSVKARNEGGLWSEAGVSSGVEAGAGTCPDAGFVANPVSGYVPLTVIFDDLSGGVVGAWQWDFGDGMTDTTQNPTHVYTETGAYTVSLLVTGPGGSDMETKAAYIEVWEGYRTYLPLVLRQFP